MLNPISPQQPTHPFKSHQSNGPPILTFTLASNQLLSHSFCKRRLSPHKDPHRDKLRRKCKFRQIYRRQVTLYFTYVRKEKREAMLHNWSWVNRILTCVGRCSGECELCLSQIDACRAQWELQPFTFRQQEMQTSKRSRLASVVLTPGRDTWA